MQRNHTSHILTHHIRGEHYQSVNSSKVNSLIEEVKLPPFLALVLRGAEVTMFIGMSRLFLSNLMELSEDELSDVN